MEPGAPGNTVSASFMSHILGKHFLACFFPSNREPPCTHSPCRHSHQHHCIYTAWSHSGWYFAFGISLCGAQVQSSFFLRVSVSYMTWMSCNLIFLKLFFFTKYILFLSFFCLTSLLAFFNIDLDKNGKQ